MKVTMMDAALKYAEANIPVIPLHWICEDGSCSCKAGSDCDSKGKHPLYTGWYNNSTTEAGGSLTKEQERQFNRYTDKIKSINESINEELLNIRTSEPILITPQKAVSPIEESKTPVTKAVSKSFRGMFYGNETVSLSNNGFYSMDEFLRTLHSGRADNRLINAVWWKGYLNSADIPYRRNTEPS